MLRLEISPHFSENGGVSGRRQRGAVMTDVTRILGAIERGDAKATDELLPSVYEELRLLAAQERLTARKSVFPRLDSEKNTAIIYQRMEHW